jgi:hypothetical protein
MWYVPGLAEMMRNTPFPSLQGRKLAAVLPWLDVAT